MNLSSEPSELKHRENINACAVMNYAMLTPCLKKRSTFGLL